MEDDKLDFGDLDDFDTQQDGLLDQTGGFTNNIEDLAALERELGIDDFEDNNKLQPTSTTELPSSSESKKPPSTNQDMIASVTSSKPVITSSSNKNSNTSWHTPPDNTANTSSSSNTRPTMTRNKHQYHNKAHRYNPYQQQQQYPSMPYQGFFPMSGGVPYGQGFFNMPMHGGMMGLPIMGYNNMSTGPPQNRRIHVNPKFAGVRPPIASQPPQTDGTRDQQRNPAYQEQTNQGKQQRSTPADENQDDHHQRTSSTVNHSRQDDRKRQREYDGQSLHQQTNKSSSQHSDQPSQRRRLDTTQSSLPATTYEDSSPQSSIVFKGNYEKLNYQHSPSTKRDIQPSTVSRLNNGISIRGAASAAASSGFNNNQTTNYTRDRHLLPPARNQQLPSPARPITENIINHGSSSNTNDHNTKQYASANDKNGMKNSILQRLGEKNSKSNNNISTDRDRNNITSNNNDAPALQFGNGKSSKLIISNMSPSVAESDLIALEPKSIKNVSLNRQDNEAALLFAAIDPAVNFRRKYNRTMIGGQHISITFAKS